MKLHVPFGEDLQEDAAKLFQGAFAYYRNYSAHDGSKIDRPSCQRIFILASELLYLIDASSIDLSTRKEISDVLESGIFKNYGDLVALLTIMDGHIFPDIVIDGFFGLSNILSVN